MKSQRQHYVASAKVAILRLHLRLLWGMSPPRIFECWLGIMLARTVMASTNLDVFESLAAGPLTAEELAPCYGLDVAADRRYFSAGVKIVRPSRFGLALVQ
jgi:hypothetical protein